MSTLRAHEVTVGSYGRRVERIEAMLVDLPTIRTRYLSAVIPVH